MEIEITNWESVCKCMIFEAQINPGDDINDDYEKIVASLLRNAADWIENSGEVCIIKDLVIETSISKESSLKIYYIETSR